jgi:hypothetical protein
MSGAMQDFLAAFNPLAEGIRANVPDNALRPYVKPIQNAIHGLKQPELDEAFRMMADLAATAPLLAAALASLLCGVFVENGGAIGIGAPGIIAAGRQAFRVAARQHQAVWGAWRDAEKAKGGELTPEEAQQLGEQAGQAFAVEERRTLARLPFFADPLCAIMERSKEVRKAVRSDLDFAQDIWMLRGQGTDSPALASKLLVVADDQPIVAVHPELRRGYLVRISGISHNFQLHILLADALIGNPEEGHLPCPRPDPQQVAMMKNQPFDPDAPPAQASFHLQTWHAIRPDRTHDTDPMAHVLWHEGTPADIPAVKGMPVVVLSPATLPRSWRAPRDWSELHGEVVIEQNYTPAQVEGILQMLSEEPRKGKSDEQRE